MWGHYGNKHQGVAIGFDSTWPLFCGTRGMRAVSYVRERPVWNMSWVPGGVEEKAFIEQLVFSKNKEWEYEDELRQLFTLDGLKRRPLSNGAQGFFLPIPPDIISTVSLGKQCPSSLEDEVRRALKGPRLSHVKLDRAMLHESDFDLRFVQ